MLEAVGALEADREGGQVPADGGAQGGDAESAAGDDDDGERAELLDLAVRRRCIIALCGSCSRIFGGIILLFLFRRFITISGGRSIFRDFLINRGIAVLGEVEHGEAADRGEEVRAEAIVVGEAAHAQAGAGGLELQDLGHLGCEGDHAVELADGGGIDELELEGLVEVLALDVLARATVVVVAIVVVTGAGGI